MKIALALEAVDDATHARARLYRSLLNDARPGFGDAAIGHPPARYFVAEILGLHPRFGFDRRFLAAVKDYTQANGLGSRGVVARYWLDEGKIYDIKKPLSWRSYDRFFARAEAGRLVRLTSEEVRACVAR